jgi:antitoxin FitA-like protein
MLRRVMQPSDARKELAMTAITLRNIPTKLQEAIRRRAGKDGLSLNKTVIRMLEEAAGQRTTADHELHYDLDHLAGTWSEEDAAAFDEALAEQRRVDPELWR